MSKLKTKTGIITIAIVLAAISRFIPHPFNLTPIGAMALFGAAYFDRKIFAFIIPIISIYLSNLVIDNVIYSRESFVWLEPSFLWVTGSFVLIAIMGLFTLKKVKVSHVLFSSLAASLIFFLITNFSVWTGGSIYSKDFAGLLLCYEAGIPFFWNTLLGDLMYCAVLFGGYEWAKQRAPQLARA
jgi:hypothetical protein